MRRRSVQTTAVLSWTPRSPWLAVKTLCWLLAVEIALAFLLGGSAALRPLLWPMVPGLALVIIPLAIWVLMAPGSRPPIGALALLSVVVLIPVLQLIPLPASVWTGLPFRDRVVELLQASGLQPGPMPFSLSPEQTWEAFLWLLSPAAVFLGVAALDLRQRLWLASVVILILIGSLTLATLQATSGYSPLFVVYKDNHERTPVGLFANRNHQAAALAVGLPLIAAVTMIWRRSFKGQWTLPQLTFIGLTALFLVGILITASRAGLAVGAIGLATALALYLIGPRAESKLKGQRWWLLAMAVLVVVIVQLGVGAVMLRFADVQEEGRFWIWGTVIKAIHASLPWGTGLGSFRSIYPAFEPIANLSPSYVNEAHDEYLQLLLEMGLLAPALLVWFLGWVGVRLAAVRRNPDWNQAALAWAAAAGIAMLMIHSLADYPLRTPALSCVFALLCACLVAPQALDGPRRSAAGHSKRDSA